MASRVVEAFLLLSLSIFIIALAYPYLLRLLSGTLEQIDLHTLESEYIKLATIIENNGAMSAPTFMRFINSKQACVYEIAFYLVGEKQPLLVFEYPALLINSNTTEVKSEEQYYLLGDTEMFGLENQSLSVILETKYRDDYLVILYTRPRIQISNEELSEDLSVFRISLYLNDFALMESPGSSAVEKIYVGKGDKIQVNTREVQKYPTLTWCSDKKLMLYVKSSGLLFHEAKESSLPLGCDGKMNIYVVNINFISKDVIRGS
jgi:hypothetical protein